MEYLTGKMVFAEIKNHPNGVSKATLAKTFDMDKFKYPKRWEQLSEILTRLEDSGFVETIIKASGDTGFIAFKAIPGCEKPAIKADVYALKRHFINEIRRLSGNRRWEGDH